MRDDLLVLRHLISAVAGQSVTQLAILRFRLTQTFNLRLRNVAPVTHSML